MLDTIYSQIGAVVLVIVCGFALWRGDRLEQWGAGLCFVAWLATILVQDNVAGAAGELGLLGVDLALLVALGVLAWRADRTWPMWAAACQSITVAIHVAAQVDLRIPQFAYISAFTLASYGVLVALAAGTFVAWRERVALSPR